MLTRKCADGRKSIVASAIGVAVAERLRPFGPRLIVIGRAAAGNLTLAVRALPVDE